MEKREERTGRGMGESRPAELRDIVAEAQEVGRYMTLVSIVKPDGKIVNRLLTSNFPYSEMLNSQAAHERLIKAEYAKGMAEAESGE